MAKPRKFAYTTVLRPDTIRRISAERRRRKLLSDGELGNKRKESEIGRAQ